MRKFLLLLFIFNALALPSLSAEKVSFFAGDFFNKDARAIRKVLKSQVKYANKNDFEKFIATYDVNYKNADGFDLEVYSSLVKNLWDVYDNIKYGLEIKNVKIDGSKAVAELVETSYAEISMSPAYEGELKSEAESIYYLEKDKLGRWKVVSDAVIDETTYMLYGDAKDLDIKLFVPIEIAPNTDYTATLEFTPPEGTIAVASIASDKVEYPQKQTEEVFRSLPEDNILERIFTSNDDNANEYVIASIGLSKTSMVDKNIYVSLTGFGYAIRRVNVLSEDESLLVKGGNDVQNR